MRKIVFDIETKNTFHDVESTNSRDLDISIVAIYDSSDDSLLSYTEGELSSLWPRIEKADVIIGYNSDSFDIPLLDKYYPGDLTSIKSIDILEKIRKSIGRRVKLDQVAEATLGEKKSGHGLEAIRWWKRGEIEKIKKYCMDDVRITKEIYEYALKEKKLHYRENGKVYDINLDTSNWEKGEESTLTHTLPI